jgi:hypothetical protein
VNHARTGNKHYFITNWNTKYKHIFIMMYHDGEADVASRVQAGQPMCRGLISIRGKEIFYFSKATPIWL